MEGLAWYAVRCHGLSNGDRRSRCPCRVRLFSPFEPWWVGLHGWRLCGTPMFPVPLSGGPFLEKGRRQDVIDEG